MSIPALKRVKIGSEQELRNWLGKNRALDKDVMVVSVADRASEKHVGRERIVAVATDYGWRAGAGYTLTGGLRGEVIRPARS